MCSSTPSESTPSKRDSSAAIRSSSGLMAPQTARQAVPNWRARPAMVACSRRSWSMAQLTARVVIEPRSATSSGTCSTNTPRLQSGSGHRQVRWRHRSRTGTTPGTSCNHRMRRPRLGAITPQSGQPISCQPVETVTVIRP